MVRVIEDADDRDPVSERLNDDNFGSSDTGQDGFTGQRFEPDSDYLSLARTIESEIIPRLLLAHRFDAHRQKTKEAAVAGSEIVEVDEFTRIVMTSETEVAYGYISDMLARGLSLEYVYLKLLAPTARRLGRMWELDDCHFTDVTIALCRMQQLLREFSQKFGNETDVSRLGFRALLAPVPSDQHTFGILMVEEFFRRSGWDTFSIPSATAAQIVQAVRDDWYAVAGLSMGCDEYAPKLAELISKIRKFSRNPSIVILVGGRYFNENPEQALALGADSTAIDGHAAISESRSLIRLIGRTN